MAFEFFIFKGILRVAFAGSVGLFWGFGASCFGQSSWVEWMDRLQNVLPRAESWLVCNFHSIRSMLIYNVINNIYYLLVSPKNLRPIKIPKTAAEQHLVRLWRCQTSQNPVHHGMLRESKGYDAYRGKGLSDLGWTRGISKGQFSQLGSRASLGISWRMPRKAKKEQSVGGKDLSPELLAAGTVALFTSVCWYLPLSGTFHGCGTLGGQQGAMLSPIGQGLPIVGMWNTWWVLAGPVKNGWIKEPWERGFLNCDRETRRGTR